MGSNTKSSPVAATTAKSKKGSKSRVITLKLSSNSLVRFAPIPIIKEDPESKTPSSTTSNTLPAATSSPGENASESNSNTPAPSGPETSAAMPPPVEAVKKAAKTGIKRSSATADGLLKPRGKPGPKKRVKLEDGTIDPITNNAKGSNTTGTAVAHKLGPKANQGAINAGLRALDRSGAPCRKWAKSSFKLKTFTGVEWEIPRWTAPPKVKINGSSEESASGGSSKENKESSHLDSEKSNNSTGDIEVGSTLSISASSPAPAVSASA